MKRLLITDKMSEYAINLIKQANVCEVIYKTELNKEELAEEIKSANALIVRSATKVTKNLIDIADSLEIIVRAGEGVDNIDVSAAKEKGIKVMNTPGANSLAVAELTIGLMFALLRNIVWANNSTKQGKWAKSKFTGSEINGKTIGFLGFGKIAKLVCKRVLALGANVITYSVPPLTDEEKSEYKIKEVSFEELLKQSDILSLHLPLLPETKNMIAKKELEIMKPSAYLINTSRGGIVNEADLAEALNSGDIKGAAVDVYCKEPIEETNPLLKCKNIILTPHLGASSKEASNRVGEMAANQVINYFKYTKLENLV